jgi:hypothetical protein
MSEARLPHTVDPGRVALVGEAVLPVSGRIADVLEQTIAFGGLSCRLDTVEKPSSLSSSTSTAASQFIGCERDSRALGALFMNARGPAAAAHRRAARPLRRRQKTIAGRNR